jgi:transposase
VRAQPGGSETHLHIDRNLIERSFNRLKQFRRVAGGFEKLALNYLSIFNLVCACIWLA